MLNECGPGTKDEKTNKSLLPGSSHSNAGVLKMHTNHLGVRLIKM